jgi:hypothetical protein
MERLEAAMYGPTTGIYLLRATTWPSLSRP